VLPQRLVFFLQYQQRSGLRQGFVFAGQLALQAGQFAFELANLRRVCGRLGGQAEFRLPRLKLVGEYPAFTTPGAERFGRQGVGVQQCLQPLFGGPFLWAFSLPAARCRWAILGFRNQFRTLWYGTFNSAAMSAMVRLPRVSILRTTSSLKACA